MSRSNRANIAKETIELVDRGWYELNGVGRVNIEPQVATCLSATRLLQPQDFNQLRIYRPVAERSTIFEVRNETSLVAARRHVVEQAKPGVLVLNFASARNPGGGFLGGSQAQEESLARSSALYASLLTQPAYYEANRACRTALHRAHDFEPRSPRLSH